MTLKQYKHLAGLPWSVVTAEPAESDATVDEIMEFMRAAPRLRLSIKQNGVEFEAGPIRYDSIFNEPLGACVVTKAETQADAIRGVWKLTWGTRF